MMVVVDVIAIFEPHNHFSHEQRATHTQQLATIPLPQATLFSHPLSLFSLSLAIIDDYEDGNGNGRYEVTLRCFTFDGTITFYS